MNHFKKAKFETMVAGGVALWDIHAMLPTNNPIKRDVKGIKRIYVHHSGALGRPGIDGAMISANYSINNSGFRSAAYHYWIPYLDLLDPNGNLTILRMNLDNIRSPHTGGEANVHGVGVVLQGNTTAKPLSHSHVQCLQALLPFLRERHVLDKEWLSWHSEGGRFKGNTKPSCPGRNAETWLKEYRKNS